MKRFRPTDEQRLTQLASALRGAQEDELALGAEDLVQAKAAADRREKEATTREELSEFWVPGFLKMMHGRTCGPPYSRRRGKKGWPVAIKWRSTPQAWLPDCTVVLEVDGRLLSGFVVENSLDWRKREYDSNGDPLDQSQSGESVYTSIRERASIDPPLMLPLDEAFRDSTAAYLSAYDDELHWPGLTTPA